MPPSEALRKAASLSAIGVVLAASVWLRPSPAPAPGVLPARIGTRPGVVIQSLRSESLFRVAVQSPHSEPVRSRFRVSSEWEVGRRRADHQLPLEELRTLPARAALDATAPAVNPVLPTASPDGGHVSRAFATAGRHTAGGFKTAARALRSVF